jgi:beta-fructofuranosidase
LPPANFMNDPNGLIQWQGRYHLFYQYNPEGPFPGPKHWGHAVSTDLVHWDDLPIALSPTPDGPDEDGCWSGYAVQHDGAVTVVYTGVRGAAQLPCVATSRDPDLVTWTKHPGNPVIAAPPSDLDILIFRDHAVWQGNGAWFQLVGSGFADAGGTALLYRSTDLINWEYLHPLCAGDRNRTEQIWTGLCWECPSFVPLGDQHVLVMSVTDDLVGYYAAYLAGAYVDLRFAPKTEGIVDFGPSLYAPQVFVDDSGRRIMFGWLREGRTERAQRAAGWSGVMSLPRILSLLPDGALGMVPAPELQTLRRNHRRFNDLTISPKTGSLPDTMDGDCLELLAVFEPGDAAGCGLKVRCSPDGEEVTVISYDCASQTLMLDARNSTLDEEATGVVSSARVPLSANEPLRLQVFLDRSVIEVFANGRACMTARIYPSRPDSLGVQVFERGGSARLRSLDVWEMDSI